MKENIISFTIRQIRHIRKGGLPTLWILLRRLLLTVLAIPVVIVTRMLRPVVLIRFGELWSDRIGHFAVNTEVYLCKRDIGIEKNQKTWDIFCHRPKICNRQLKKMWDRTLHVSWIAVGGYTLNRVLPGGEKHLIFLMDEIDGHRLLARAPIHLSFTNEEERSGEIGLRNMEVPKDTPFVCFHARDSMYLDAVYSKRDWGYHNYRDSNIRNYIPAMEELVRRGYYAFRMGAAVKNALNPANPRIIDYATKYRTDFFDIYLLAKCQFFVNGNNGTYGIPFIFRRPIVIVNYIPLKYANTALTAKDLIIPKKLWLREEHRFLSFREILESEVKKFFLTEQYERYDIEVIENAPEEITDVVLEMDERLKGTWKMTEEDEELQQRFWSLFSPSELNQGFRSRIGAEFLRQNRELLE